MKSIFVSHWSTFVHQIDLKILSKTLNHEKQVTDLHTFIRSIFVSLIHYPKYDIPPSNNHHDIKQNHWTLKNRSQSYICTKWTASSEFGTYRLCEQRRFRQACASAQSRQNLRCSLIQAVSQEEPSDRKPDPWPLWMTGHAQLKFVMTECSKTQIRLTGLKCCQSLCHTEPLLQVWHSSIK